MEGPERFRSRPFTNYTSRPQTDMGPVYNGFHHNVQPYSTSSGLDFMANNSFMHYSTLSPSYSTFSPAYSPISASSPTTVLLPYAGSSSMTYSVQPPPRATTLPSQNRIMSRSYGSSNMQSQYSSGHTYRGTPPDYSILMDTEEQDSVNRESGRSEPIDPPLEGYPDVDEFDTLMTMYVAQLSPKKQDKALINARRASNIRYVLSNKKTTSVESAQFRFWVKKMFQLQPNLMSIPMEKRKICHENKPIAVREKLFKILSRAHQKCQHGGRDKTSAQVRKVYSWVPKELISRFVKLCPTCRERRGAACATDGDQSPNLSAKLTEATSNQTKSPRKRSRSDISRRTAHANTPDMPVQLMNGSTTFQNQNRWLSGFAPFRSAYTEHHPPSMSFSNTGSLKELDSVVRPSHSSLQTVVGEPQDPIPSSSHASPMQQEVQYKHE